ncbi:DUF2490 domain-containing protein [Tenacibaculum sp. 190524A02b]|uniref:DUF2490 domain-containing protein n=1 Tax=Tenacibaculum vairaonense TaxID=3137860 RepID=UPI0031FB8336
MKKYFYFLILAGISNASLSQTTFSNGWLPKVNFSKKISSTVKWVNSIEARQLVYKDNFQFTHSLLDISSIVSVKTNLNQSVNLGYIIRFKGEKTVHRLTQQYSIITNYDALKIGHRFGFEEFFEDKKTPQFRTRYRIALQKALSGEKVDVKEWYFKLTNEYLWQFNKEDLEIRLSPYLGYQLSKKDKLEFGLDYRLGSLINSYNSHNLWFRTTWYISL